MNRVLGWLALGAVAWAAPAFAVEQAQFFARTQQNVVDLCTAADDDPLQPESIAFCHGFLIGAYSAHQTEHSGPGVPKLICPPDPAPTRAEAIGMYIDWAKAHPEYANESSIESLFKFLIEKWPCPSVATGAAKGGGK
ncbi:MAG TPA: Rap1a/Tai family immunity protein [Myxococcota bacterium]|jgi:hypothetical protein|nr:Rap1a/Tai family immunity protein [Myxococcota bacterium]